MPCRNSLKWLSVRFRSDDCHGPISGRASDFLSEMGIPERENPYIKMDEVIDAMTDSS